MEDVSAGLCVDGGAYIIEGTEIFHVHVHIVEEMGCRHYRKGTEEVHEVAFEVAVRPARGGFVIMCGTIIYHGVEGVCAGGG